MQGSVRKALSFPSTSDARTHRALAEHQRVVRELAELEGASAGSQRVNKQHIAALRFCRHSIERDLCDRGYRFVGGRWQRIAHA
ncbi:MAG: hypothetical protein AB7S26_13345 [Sandaracinaceae bacterium]